MKETESDVSVHISDLKYLPVQLLEKAERAFEVFKHLDEPGTFQVVSVSKTLDHVQLLSYPKFWDQTFPELKESWTIEFMNGGTRIQHHRYDAKNPPILHHKEDYVILRGHLFLRLKEITKRCEAAGCFDKPIENRNQWIQILNEKGIEL